MKILVVFTCLFFTFLISVNTYGQKKTFNGRVADEKTNEPLEFVSVYINNSTIGTITGENGKFSLILDPGKYEVVISMVGYGPIIHPLEIKKYEVTAPVLFKIVPQTYALDTISIIAKRDASWYANLQSFKDYFLGKSAVAKKCKLLNPEALITIFDPAKQILTITAREPLRIENPELGYKISYLLIEFVLDKKEGYSTYLGYPLFEVIKGSKAEMRNRSEKRLHAYMGSSVHFVRALRDQKLEQEGFKLTKSVNSIGVDPNGAVIDGKPVFIPFTTQTDVSYSEYLSYPDNRAKMTFEGSYQVVYMREMEDLEYVYSQTSKGLKKASYQKSMISLKDPYVFLLEDGSFDKPLGIKFEGYWSWDKVGDMVPFDYRPEAE